MLWPRMNGSSISRQARKLAVKAGVTVAKKEDVSHTLVVLKKKWLQSLGAWGKRRAIEPMTGATDDFSEMPGSAYCGISHKKTAGP